MRCCAGDPRRGGAAFTAPRNSLPSRCGKMRRGLGSRPKSSMGASGEKYATKRWPGCTGKAAKHLKQNISLVDLEQRAMQMSDTECARKMTTVKAKLLRDCKTESLLPPRFL